MKNYLFIVYLMISLMALATCSIAGDTQYKVETLPYARMKLAQDLTSCSAYLNVLIDNFEIEPSQIPNLIKTSEAFYKLAGKFYTEDAAKFNLEYSYHQHIMSLVNEEYTINEFVEYNFQKCTIIINDLESRYNFWVEEFKRSDR